MSLELRQGRRFGADQARVAAAAIDTAERRCKILIPGSKEVPLGRRPTSKAERQSARLGPHGPCACFPAVRLSFSRRNRLGLPPSNRWRWAAPTHEPDRGSSATATGVDEAPRDRCLVRRQAQFPQELARRRQAPIPPSGWCWCSARRMCFSATSRSMASLTCSSSIGPPAPRLVRSARFRLHGWRTGELHITVAG